MKKFLGILAVAAVFASCDNAGSNEQRVKDSTDSARRADSMANAMPAPSSTPAMGGDTMNMSTPAPTMGGDTMNRMSGDTMNAPK